MKAKTIATCEELGAKLPGLNSSLSQIQAEYSEALAEFHYLRLNGSLTKPEREAKKQELFQMSRNVETASYEVREVHCKLERLEVPPTQDAIKERFATLVLELADARAKTQEAQGEYDIAFAKMEASQLKYALNPNDKTAERSANRWHNKFRKVGRVLSNCEKHQADAERKIETFGYRWDWK